MRNENKLGKSLVDHNNKNYYDLNDEISAELMEQRKSFYNKFRQEFVDLFEMISNSTKTLTRTEFLT